MEAPAILSGLYIAHKKAPKTRNHKKEEKKLYREIFTMVLYYYYLVLF